MPISVYLCQASAMLLAVCPLVAALQTGFGRPGLVQAPSVSTGPARFAAASPYSSARLPAAVSMIATDKSPVVDDLTKYYEGDAPLEERMWEYVKKRGGDRLIRRILIANNGMAATKSIMSIRQWAYETFGDEKAVEFVVMATPEDLTVNAEFIRRADEFIEVPGGSNANNYANVQLIVDLCLSENVRPTSRPPTLAPATHALALAPPPSNRTSGMRRPSPRLCAARTPCPRLTLSPTPLPPFLSYPRLSCPRPLLPTPLPPTPLLPTPLLPACSRRWTLSWSAGATPPRTPSWATCSRCVRGTVRGRVRVRAEGAWRASLRQLPPADVGQQLSVPTRRAAQA